MAAPICRSPPFSTARAAVTRGAPARETAAAVTSSAAATIGCPGGVDCAVGECQIESGFHTLVRLRRAAVGIGREMKRKYTWLDAIPYLAALISCAPLIAGGFPLGHDWTFELARVAEFSHALEEGQFPPHWAPNLY